MNKLELVRKYEQEIQKDIDTKQRWWKEAREAYYKGSTLLKLPKFPEEPGKTFFGEASATFEFRYDRNLIRNILALFEKTEWKKTWEHREEKINDNWSDPYYEFLLDGFNIKIRFNDKLGGSTCTRKQIGKEMREVPVYEWNCGEE